VLTAQPPAGSLDAWDTWSTATLLFYSNGSSKVSGKTLAEFAATNGAKVIKDMRITTDSGNVGFTGMVDEIIIVKSASTALTIDLEDSAMLKFNPAASATWSLTLTLAQSPI
jgi:hypothetical protein